MATRRTQPSMLIGARMNTRLRLTRQAIQLIHNTSLRARIGCMAEKTAIQQATCMAASRLTQLTAQTE